MTFGADREATMATIIYDTEHVEVEAELSSRWLMSPEAVESLTGWALKPEGFCRGDVCSPIFNPDKVLSHGMVDLQEAAPLLGLLAVTDLSSGVAALTASAHERADDLASLKAPDFTLESLSGDPVSLHDFNRRKVLLLAWSSW